MLIIWISEFFHGLSYSILILNAIHVVSSVLPVTCKHTLPVVQSARYLQPCTAVVVIWYQQHLSTSDFSLLSLGSNVPKEKYSGATTSYFPLKIWIPFHSPSPPQRVSHMCIPTQHSTAPFGTKQNIHESLHMCIIYPYNFWGVFRLTIVFDEECVLQLIVVQHSFTTYSGP